MDYELNEDQELLLKQLTHKIKLVEEKILKSIMEDLKNDIEDKRDEFIKYHQMINSDQVGES